MTERLATLRNGLNKVRRAATTTVVLAGTALFTVTLASPSRAALYHWNFAGNFSNNVGPVQKGSFFGYFNWDTTAGLPSDPMATPVAPTFGIVPLTTYLDPATQIPGYTAGNGTGGFTHWDFRIFDQTGTFVERFHSHNLDGPNDQTAAMTTTVNPLSGCFGSPLAKGNGATGTYFESDVAGVVCSGSQNYISNGNFPSAGDVGAGRAAVYFATVQDESFTFPPAGADVTFTHSYFRFPMTAPVDTNGVIDGSDFKVLPGINAQSDEWYGWAAYKFGLVESGGLESASVGCVGDNTAVPVTPACPYSGNNQPRQGITGANFVLQQAEIPAPLPLAGTAPLAVALRKLSRKRASLLAGRIAVKL